MARKHWAFGDTLASADLEDALVGLEAADSINFHRRGDWDAVTPYFLNDVVWVGNAAWIALATNTNSAPASGNANWKAFGVVTAAATTGALGSVKMSVAPASSTSPIALGANDPIVAAVASNTSNIAANTSAIATKANFRAPDTAIPDSDGTLADTARAVNAILATLRTRGAISP